MIYYWKDGYWSPPWIIAWRAIWWIPFHISRVVLTTFALLGWGINAASSMWEATG